MLDMNLPPSLPQWSWPRHPHSRTHCHPTYRYYTYVLQIHGYCFQCPLVILFSPFKYKLLRFSGSWSQSLPFSSSPESPYFYLSTVDYSLKNQKVLENQADTWDPACISQIQNSSISQSSFSSLDNPPQPITPQSANLWSQRLYRYSPLPVSFSSISLSHYWVLKF